MRRSINPESFTMASRYTHQGIVLFAITILLLYSLLIAFGSLDGFPTSMSTGFLMPYLADKPVGEDGYYMLTVAWNIASGNGIVIRPGAPTTGIQPLTTFIYAGIAKIVMLAGGEKFDLSRWVIMFGGLNQILFSIIIGLITQAIAKNTLKESSVAVTIAVIVVITSFYIFRVFTYGLETGIYLTVFSLLLYLTVILLPINNLTPSLPKLFLIGFAAGLTGLARIDFGIIFAVFLVFMLVSKTISLRQAIIIGLTALMVVFPWLAWVKSISGHWVPSSGIAQSSLIEMNSVQGRVLAFYGAISQNLLPSFFTGGKEFMVAVTSLPLFFLLYLTVSFMRSWQGVKKKVWIGWFLGCVALMLIYPVFFWATHFYARYTSPILVVMLPISSIAVAAAMMNFKLVSSNHNRIIAFFGFILIGINVALATLSLHTGRIGNSHSLSAGYVRDHLPTSAVVGAFQSGVIGYFNENIINLDGKVNPEVLDALSRGQVNEYVIEYNIEYVIDWVDIVTKSFLTIPNAWAIWEKCKAIVPNGESLCIQRVR